MKTEHKDLMPRSTRTRSQEMLSSKTFFMTPSLPRSAMATDDGAILPGLYNWRRVAELMIASRTLDRIEEERLVPQKLVTYQFSSRGHDLAQVLLGLLMTNPNDAATVYYRSRPFVMSLGLTAEEGALSTMGRSGGISEGRDIGVVHNMPSRGAAHVLPTSGDVGAQYTPAVGWAQAIRYRAESLGQAEWKGAMAAALGGDASCATSGFWAALNIATVERLPFLFFIEDNGFGISVPGRYQTPGANIAANLASFTGLTVLQGSGVDPIEAGTLIARSVDIVRAGDGPVLLRLVVPRLAGHSSTDNQAYKSSEQVEREKASDPLPLLQNVVLGQGLMTMKEWDDMEQRAIADTEMQIERAIRASDPDIGGVLDNLYYTPGFPQQVGGLLPEIGEEEGEKRLAGTRQPDGSGPRMNMIDAVRQTLIGEMERNDRILVFGEDVGMKGGVHGATVDLQRRFGVERVFDTSLNEEGIIGRAVGMALAGVIPVPEIQFRKYADPAHEQITDCGTMRWRTAGKYAAPMVVRIPVGFGKKTGDPWHSVSGEAIYAHLIGWRIAYPSNAQDAVGLLRTALRGNDPTFFFEHRALLDTREGRRPYPGDDYMIPFGSANIVRAGDELTIVTWGEMAHRGLEGAEKSGRNIEVIDLRSVTPWDRETVLQSVRKTGRCIVLHEDNWTCGFGAEIAAVIAQEAFPWLDAPVERMATPDCPIPYNPALMHAVVPTVEGIVERIGRTLAF